MSVNMIGALNQSAIMIKIIFYTWIDFFDICLIYSVSLKPFQSTDQLSFKTSENKTVKTVLKGCTGLTVLENREI